MVSEENSSFLKVSRSFIVGIDISVNEDDIAMVMVTEYKSPKDIKHINTFYGDDAIALYEILKGVNKNE